MGPRILVVDDDGLIRRIMRDALTTLPADVMEATNGEEAITTARTEQPDLIFMDTMMPKLDGFQAAGILKQDPATANIPLVFVSALGTSSHKVRGLDLGAEDYIAKPVDPEELKARVRSILRRARPAAPAPEPSDASVAKGQLQTMPFPSLVRWLESEQRSARLLLTRGEEAGEVLFKDGRITHASQGLRLGDTAVYQLLTWAEGTFNINPPVGLPPQAGAEISASNEDLLKEGMRRLEEVPGLRAPFPGSDVFLEIPVTLRTALQPDLSPATAMLVGILDATRNLDRVLADSPFDAWMTLKALQCLLRVGALGWAPAAPAADQAVSPRRSIPRVSVQGSLQYQALYPVQQSDRFTLSARGVFVQTPTPLEVGEQAVLRIQFPGAANRVTAVGQVIWRNADPTKSGPEDLGMGLQFVDLAAEDLGAIEERLTEGIVAEIRQALGKP
jgi:DNA-binding response OmpR family regulator/Tfp pilus assembly protein PilZ